MHAALQPSHLLRRRQLYSLLARGEPQCPRSELGPHLGDLLAVLAQQLLSQRVRLEALDLGSLGKQLRMENQRMVLLSQAPMSLALRTLALQLALDAMDSHRQRLLVGHLYHSRPGLRDALPASAS